MRVYLNTGLSARKLVEAGLVKRNTKTVWVELPGKSGRDPKIIKRKIGRDVPASELDL